MSIYPMAYSRFEIQSSSKPDSFQLDSTRVNSLANMPGGAKILFNQRVPMIRFSLIVMRTKSQSSSSKERSNKSGSMQVCIARVVPAANLAFMTSDTRRQSID